MRNGLMMTVMAGCALAAGQVQAQVVAITDLYSTGVNAAGNGLQADTLVDLHYTLAGGTAYVSDQTQYPIVSGPWVADTATSKWITPNPNPGTGQAAVSYDYQTTFNNTSLIANSIVITGKVAADDQVEILVNGNLALNYFGGYSAFTGFTLNSSNSLFHSGVNTLDFIALNSGGGPTGLQVQISGVGSLGAVPEPGNVALLTGMGLSGAGFLVRRRRSK